MFAASAAMSATRLPHYAVTSWNGRGRVRLAQVLDHLEISVAQNLTKPQKSVQVFQP
jgi:hypothetical protein